ncbi:amidophosphoribosyltransferase [Sphingobium sp. SA2]|jgi:amidophosphoribosyltransferase|nr:MULTISPECIES: amidophosphoribosyltransferase [Sphingobium]OHC96104.1 MAG: amidophosphoribosyltransferase [Sphingomonadales bacterium RIFCSPLOWO2_12_FULL_63_15]AOF97668.1 amidophosphoribosyltransferase [Sphingobium sp. RAC03]KFL46376.1 amidophosphoribosyltransferase [Sphingobium sp. ba1]MDT7535804.1 amidophosphoribosyltransferase [Sphingobium sp. SA2]PBN45536.1 amidophosphoribosyltransferase [Sphingobium sp. D43FB]|tara:strand:- start:2831 stop:4309 length:1479 start_codon:yes stop_codon:yes gene_type:complete
MEPLAPMMTTNPFDDDKLREECGIFGVSGADTASAIVALGLHALQHRGQEAAGITSWDGHDFHTHRAMGHVAGNFDRDEVIRGLPGDAACGHVRYSTTGETSLRNVQPLYAELNSGGFAIAHNGNISNAMKVRRELIRRGSIFQSTSDTEVIIHLVATSSYRTLLDKFIDALKQVEGAYSLIVMTPEGMIACRDPLGIRPLVMGKLGDTTIFASETVALDVVGAEYLRTIEPGELVIVTNEGEIRSHRPFGPVHPRPCIFEHVYFSRPDSIVDGSSVYSVRKAIGAQLAIENPVEADYVIPVPDSGVPAAIGYAQQSGIPFELGIIRSHYIGRTFIQPGDKVRHLGVKLKHNANRALIKGKRIVLIDDSIVRGTTSLKIVQMMREAGAAEVHMRIASPPTKHSCFYGVDTPERTKLLAHKLDVGGMQDFIHADSLSFISIDGLYKALGEAKRADTRPQYCDACFTGDYPTALTDQDDVVVTNQLELLAERVA